jgi:pimeloyl-ACP methyl ester carboxylesterase
MRSVLITCLLLLGPGCSTVSPARSAPQMVVARAGDTSRLQGRLLTYQGSTLVGEEVYRDDGDELSSVVKLGPKRNELKLSRSRASVSCNGRPPVQLDPQTLALENGSWQSYAIAAERFSNATQPRKVKVLLPCSGITAAGTVSVNAEGAGRRVKLQLGPLGIDALVDERGAVVEGTVPAQNLRVRAEEGAQRAVARPPAPALQRGESELSIERGGVQLKGTLALPQRAATKVPIALILAGSGPTDRDGNSLPGLNCDAYRMLAAELAARGIATVRYDKRGVGASGRNFAPSSILFEDLVQDAVAWADFLRKDGRFHKLTLIGHSEGGLVALRAAQRVAPDAVVLVATPGRKLELVLREQIGSRSSPALLTEYDRIVLDLHDGRPLDPVPEELVALFNPDTRGFVTSLFAVDPVAELRKLVGVRISVVQGGSDLQIGMIDAEALSSAGAGVRQVVLPTMNHVLKQEPNRSFPQASYADSTRPLADGLVDAIASSVARP